MAAPTTRLWTYDDYAAMPDDGRRYEIIEGELVEMPGARTRHQDIQLEIAMILRLYTREHHLGKVYVSPYDVLLSPVNVVQPDVLFVSAANMAIIGALNVQGAPNLCVEVLSPGSSTRDLREKRRLYARFGVREYWVVDPERDAVTVLTLDGDAYTTLVEATGDAAVRSLALPGFAAPAAAFFPA